MDMIHFYECRLLPDVHDAVVASCEGHPFQEQRPVDAWRLGSQKDLPGWEFHSAGCGEAEDVGADGEEAGASWALGAGLG